MGPKASTALITGASGGIGFELAKLFAKDRYNLVLGAQRRQAKADCGQLQEEFGVKVKTVALDLARDKPAKFCSII